jgi:hypothetical protein
LLSRPPHRGWPEREQTPESKEVCFFTLATAMLFAGLVVLPMNATKKLRPGDR